MFVNQSLSYEVIPFFFKSYYKMEMSLASEIDMSEPVPPQSVFSPWNRGQIGIELRTEHVIFHKLAKFM